MRSLNWSFEFLECEHDIAAQNSIHEFSFQVFGNAKLAFDIIKKHDTLADPGHNEYPFQPTNPVHQHRFRVNQMIAQVRLQDWINGDPVILNCFQNLLFGGRCPFHNGIMHGHLRKTQ